MLESNCLGCHNPKLKMANLSLASRADLLKGGKRGPAVVPGKPEDSRLLQAIRHEGNLRMPPGSRLPDTAITLLTDWIRQGAPWPDSAVTRVPGQLNH